MKFLTIIFLILGLSSQATNIYFSNTGSDGGAGTELSPYASMTKLAAIISSYGAGDSILFKRGDTFYGKIPTPPNGTSGSFIVFGAYGVGVKPVISGFTDLGSWTSLGSNIWEASVNSGLHLDLVIVDELMRHMGRTPNYGSYYNIDSYTDIGEEFPTPPTATITSSSVPVGTRNYTGSELVMAPVDWSIDRNRITGHSSTTLSFDVSSYNNNSSNGNKFFLQDNVGTLDQQNEWYYNSTAHTIRMYSTTDPGGLGVKASTQDFLFNASSSGAHDISFVNLKFIGADSLALFFNTPNRININNCDIFQSGNDGISVFHGTNVTVDSCNISSMGNTGIATRQATGIRIRDNMITDCGLIIGMGLSNNQQHDGIMVENGLNTDSIVITRNVINNVGYCGIRWSGGRASITRNYINNYGLIKSDGGGIYTNYNDEDGVGQRLVAYNVVLNGIGNHEMRFNSTNGGQPGLYCDDGSKFVDLLYNTVEASTRFGTFLHNNQHITVAYNKFYLCKDDASVGIVHDFITTSRFIDVHDNTIYSAVNMIGVSSIADDVSSTGTFSNNIYCRASSGNMFYATGTGGGAYPLSTWKSTWSWDAGATFTQIIADSMRLVYNYSSVSAVTNLGASYRDLSGNNYASSITLAPYSSEILRKITTIEEDPGDPDDGEHPGSNYQMGVKKNKRRLNVKL